jgi:hypothetical protein
VVTEINDTDGTIRFRVTNTSDFDVSIENISAQLLTCSAPNVLLSTSQRIIEKRIDLGQVQFDSVNVVKKISNSDIIYTIQANTSGFFKLSFSPNQIKQAKNQECNTGNNGRSMNAGGNLGDLFLRVTFPNPTSGTNEKVIKKIN